MPHRPELRRPPLPAAEARLEQRVVALGIQSMGRQQQRDHSPALHSNTPTHFGVLGVDLCMPLWADSGKRM